jgi:hypothetical protein
MTGKERYLGWEPMDVGGRGGGEGALIIVMILVKKQRFYDQVCQAVIMGNHGLFLYDAII